MLGGGVKMSKKNIMFWIAVLALTPKVRVLFWTLLLALVVTFGWMRKSNNCPPAWLDPMPACEGK